MITILDFLDLLEIMLRQLVQNPIIQIPPNVDSVHEWEGKMKKPVWNHDWHNQLGIDADVAPSQAMDVWRILWYQYVT